MKKTITATCVALLLLAGCATNPKDIAPAYVSPAGYQNMTCKQLQVEAESVSARAAQASGAQEKKANDDAALTTVGIVIFWPALLFMNHDGAQAAEVSRLKGEMQAIEGVSRAKNCGIVFAAQG
jgi:hypothetical protein